MEPGIEPSRSRRPRRSRQARTSASWTASSAAYPSRRIRPRDRVQAVVCGGREGIECLVVAPLCAFDEFGRQRRSPRSGADDLPRSPSYGRQRRVESFSRVVEREPCRPSGDARQDRASLLERRQPRRVAGSRRRRWRPGRRRRAARSSKPRRRSVGRWPTSAQEAAGSRRWRRPPPVAVVLGRRRGAERDADEWPARGRRTAAVEVEHLGQDDGAGPCRAAAGRASRCAWPSAWTRPDAGAALPGRRRPGARRAASASAPRGPCRRRRPAAATRATVRMTPSADRLGERVRVAPTGATRASGSSRRRRWRRSRPAAGRRSAPGRGSSRRAAATGGRRSPCGRPPRR